MTDKEWNDLCKEYDVEIKGIGFDYTKMTKEAAVKYIKLIRIAFEETFGKD